jgi:hypothetical protein
MSDSSAIKPRPAYPFSLARSPNLRVIPHLVLSPDTDARDNIEGWSRQFRLIRGET